MKHLIIFIGLTSLAATADAETWSLDRCIDYAIEHNIDVRSRGLDHASAEIDVTEAKSNFLPTVNAGASQHFGFGRGLTSDNTYVSRNTSQTGWSVDLSLPLFQGLSNVRRLKYAKANLKAIAEEWEAAKENVAINITAQYLQVLYCREMHEVAQEQLRMSTVEMERRTALLETGKIPELDLTQARSQVAQDGLAVVNAENDYQLALLDLTQMMQLPSPDGFEVMPVDDKSGEHLTAEGVYANALEYNHTVRAAALSVDAADRNISLARTGYMPRLGLTAGIGSSYYHLNGETNPPFHRQMRDNLSKNIGLTLTIPIFDAFSTRNSVKKAQVQKLSAELRYEDARTQLYKTIQQAYRQAVAAKAKEQSSRVASEATKAALDAMQEKYNYGRANATEYEQAKSDYIKSLSEAVQAKYEAILRSRILQFYNTDNRF